MDKTQPPPPKENCNHSLNERILFTGIFIPNLNQTPKKLKEKIPLKDELKILTFNKKKKKRYVPLLILNFILFSVFLL